ncbi:hypothetical protein, variant [Aphanomyces invadans]|uniref:Uncharacterized protein n=1 Tax=Aphanomyces invadans TaxID=157072 RepID=A0A024UEA7_9STRA|nr:hypothetical protein, variant [Aphanomyces invadans]ETW04609.1 hypothetical protein, variant [Aphanomyces invadans]|eukprot:XP_008866046.1 hypothetical protein, variant [Aphanomyces invadans]
MLPRRVRRGSGLYSTHDWMECSRLGHSRYGATFDTALHPTWSESNPVHLIGHSYGATTALELYQLLCVDFFGIGSNYKWVKSVVSISGTLSGTTIGSMLGSTLGNPSPFGTISYWIACGFATLHKLQQHVPCLSLLYDLRMPQWSESSSWRTLYNPAHKPLNTDDNVFTCLLPQHRLEKNHNLVHMDKIHLFSIVSQTASVLTYPPVVEMVSIAALLAMWKLKKPKLWIGLLSLWLCRRLAKVDWSKPSLFLAYFMRRHAENADAFFEGFDKDAWQHSDGVVNSYSMIRPRLSLTSQLPIEESPQQDGSSSAVMVRVPSHVSIDMGEPDVLCATIPMGQWHVYRVAKNHLCGTRGDSDARELYTRLFRLLNQISGLSFDTNDRGIVNSC